MYNWHGTHDTSLIKSVRLQNLKDQILTTNVWLEHVSHISHIKVKSYKKI